MKRTLKAISVIIDVVAIIFNIFMFGAYIYALCRGYKMYELDMEYVGVAHYVFIDGVWALKSAIVKIAKAIKSRKK